MQAHAHDLRAEVEHDWTELTGLATSPTPAVADDWVHQVVDDWRSCELRPAIRSLLEYAEKLSLLLLTASQADVIALRTAGWSDRAIHDAVQIAAYFNYINRVADSLGIDPEPGLPSWGGR